jgi:serine/threonine protein phosphatase PrpC
VSRSAFGLASDSGGRPYQDDRSTAFSARLPDGTRVSVAAVLDGHHGYQISELIADKLPWAFITAVEKWPGDLESALVSNRN